MYTTLFDYSKWFASSSLVIITGLFLTMSSGAMTAQECESLSPFDCSISESCTLATDKNTQSGYFCRAAANVCEIGFRQHIPDLDGSYVVTPQEVLSETCETKEECEYVKSGSCYCPPIDGLECYCSGGTPPSCRLLEQTKKSPPVGNFIIVSVRNASDVAHTASSINEEDIVGNWINFHETGLEIEGMDCDSWTILKVAPVANLDDPNLADVMIAPVNISNSSGDARELISYKYTCEGEEFLSLTKVDDRVVVIPWNNSASYLVAEIPLNEAEIMRFQKIMQMMNFFEGPTTGQMDEMTTLTFSKWTQYRSDSENNFRFLRPAITRNLLDTLNVLEIR